MNKFKKKSVALFATMMVAVAAAGYVYQQNQAEESLLSELAMANVEALAHDEDAGSHNHGSIGRAWAGKKSYTGEKEVNREIYPIEFSEENIRNYKSMGVCDETSFIVLKEDPDRDLQVSQIGKILCQNDRIYVADTYLKKLIAFDMEGNALFEVGSVGSGPGEYASLSDFHVTLKNEVYLFDGSAKKIHLYDSTNKYVRSFNLSFSGEHFSMLENGEFIFSLAPFNEGEAKGKQIVITDDEFKVKGSLIEFDKNIDPTSQFISPLTEYDDQIIYNRSVSKDVYVFSKSGELKRIIELDFGDLAISSERQRDINKLLDSSDEYSYIVMSPILKGNKLLSILSKSGEYYTCICDLETKKVGLNSIQKYSASSINMPLSINSGGKIISYINSDIYPEYKSDAVLSDDLKSKIEAGLNIVSISQLD